MVDSADLKPINLNEYDVISPFSEGLARMSRNGKKGYVMDNGIEDTLLNKKLNYAGMGDFHCGLAMVISPNKKVGYIDKSGKEVFACKYDFIQESIYCDRNPGANSSSVASTEPIQFSSFGDFKDGVAIVEVDSPKKKFGLISASGKELTPIKYKTIKDFHDGIAVVSVYDENENREFRDGAFYGYINKMGHELTSIKYTKAECFYGNYGYLEDKQSGYLYCKDGRTLKLEPGVGKLSDGSGRTFTFAQGATGDNFTDEINGVTWIHNYVRVSDGLLRVQYGDCKCIDIVSFTCANQLCSNLKNKNIGICSDFTEGIASALLGGSAVISGDYLKGYIDKTGNWQIKPSFLSACHFSQGRAAISKPGSKLGYIDSKGNEITPLKYDDASDFRNGVAIVKINNSFCLIDRTGKEVSPMYDEVLSRSEGKIVVRRGDSYGYFDTSGMELIAPKYQRVSFFLNGLAVVFKDQLHTFYVDLKGREYIEQ